MGQDASEILTRTGAVTPEDAHWTAYDILARDCSSEDVDIEDEYHGWVKEGKKVLEALKKKGLPLTVENGCYAFNKTGPFERVKR